MKLKKYDFPLALLRKMLYIYERHKNGQVQKNDKSIENNTYGSGGY